MCVFTERQTREMFIRNRVVQSNDKIQTIICNFHRNYTTERESENWQ